MPPPGLLRLGGELLLAGFDVALDDLAFRLANGEIQSGDELGCSAAQWLLARGAPRVLGLSTMGATLPAALAIAKHYKRERPATPILIGGPGTTGTDQALLERFPFIDAVVRGEGEFPITEGFAAAVPGGLPDWSGIAGVTWRDSSGGIVREQDRPARKDLARVADYAWGLLPPLPDYKALTGEPEGLTPLDSGRGCAFDCSFCTIGRYWQRRSRPLPADRLANEILGLQSMPGASQAYLCHDIFGADRSHALDLCERLILAGSPVPFEVRARVDHLDPELLGRMAQAGCYRVLLGIESASAIVRERHQKNMREGADPLGVIDACEAVGIVPILSLILGLPGEGPAERALTLDLCSDASLRRGVNLSLHLVNPQPGCTLGETYGARSQPIEDIAPDMALGCGFSSEEKQLIAEHPDLFCSFHLLPAEEFEGGIDELKALASIAKGLPEILRRYPRTFAILRRQMDLHSLSLWNRFEQSGLSFAGWVRGMDVALLDDCLAWEQASIRVAARCPLAPPGAHQAQAGPGPDGRDSDLLPRQTGEILRSRFDLGALAKCLREGSDLPPLGPPSPFAVIPGPGLFGSVRTLRISSDAERLLQWLDCNATRKGAATPAARKALVPLQAAGLVGQ